MSRAYALAIRALWKAYWWWQAQRTHKRLRRTWNDELWSSYNNGRNDDDEGQLKFDHYDIGG